MRKASKVFTLLLGLVLSQMLTCYEIRAITVIRSETQSDSLQNKNRTAHVGNYDWEHFWKIGSIREVSKAAVSDSDAIGWLPGIRSADLSKLKNKFNVSEFKFMAIGGSTASGVRDGGVYREAQLSAYPNLIARQMGVAFRQPLFSESEANGSGYKLLIDRPGPVFQYETVTNSLAFDNKSDTKEFSKLIGDYDNLALPFFNVRYPWKTMEYYDRPVSEIDEESTDFVRYFKRIISDQDYSDSKLTYLSFLRRKSVPDFIIYDLGMDGHLKEAIIGGYVSQLPMLSEDKRGNRIEFWFLKEIAAKGSKGVLVTIPDVLDFPYFHMYSLEKLKKLSPGIQVVVQKNNGKARNANKNDIFLPGNSVFQLFTDKTDRVLKETEVITVDEDLDETAPFRSVKWYNDYYVKYTAKENNFAVFDLYDLYKRINTGKYVTDDGIFADPSFPNGNFYSSDGIHPSAFGQAIIANECIKAINSYYGTEVELLPTAGFVKAK